MKTKILIILFLINASIGFSQPGYITEEKNLNDYSDAEIKECKDSPHEFQYSFIIDSKTHLNKIKHCPKKGKLTQCLLKIPDLTEFKFLEKAIITDNKNLKISDSYKNGWKINDNGI